MSCYDSTQPKSEANGKCALTTWYPSQRALRGKSRIKNVRRAVIAIFHASTKPISRSAGRSSVAAAAYRSGSELVDQRTGLVHDYTRRHGVVSTEIILADGSSAERNALWNAAEVAENRKDARTGREWIVALPAELDEAQRQELAIGFGIELATRYGVAVDLAIHLPDREGDNRNHHAHVLTTTREVSRDAGGQLVLGEKSSIELSDTKRRALGLGSGADEVKAIRQLWERMANGALEQAGSTARIDSRSLKAQGQDREATTHLGPVASDMERRHKASDRGDSNRQVAANNRERENLTAQIFDLSAHRMASAQKAQPEPGLPKGSTAEIERQIRRLRLPSVDRLVERDAGVIALSASVTSFTSELDVLIAQDRAAQTAMAEWRAKHPRLAKLHDLGWLKSSILIKGAGYLQEGKEAKQNAQTRLDQAAKSLAEKRDQLREQIGIKQAPIRAQIQSLETVLHHQNREQRLSEPDFKARSAARRARIQSGTSSEPEKPSENTVQADIRQSTAKSGLQIASRPRRARGSEDAIRLLNGAPPEAIAETKSRMEDPVYREAFKSTVEDLCAERPASPAMAKTRDAMVGVAITIVNQVEDQVRTYQVNQDEDGPEIEPGMD